MKTFKTIVLSLSIMSVSITSVSCGEVGAGLLSNLVANGANTGAAQTNTGATSTKTQLIMAGAGLLQQLLQGNKEMAGKKQTYEGTYTAQLLSYDAKSKGYLNNGAEKSMKATTTLTIGSSAVAISMPAIATDKGSMTQVTLTNLVATNNVYALSDNSTVTEGKLTVGGKTYDLANAYVQLTVNGTTSCAYTASIYFDFNEASQQYMHAMNLTFK